jgi:MATE family multidrug resistance protein
MKKNNLFPTMYQVILFALPISAGGLVNAIASFVSMMMVAVVGKEQLAAGSLANTTFMTVMTVTATVFYSVGILISLGRSQNKSPAEIGLIVKNSFCLAIFFAVPAGLGLWYADKLLLFFRQDPQLVTLTRDYFHFAAINMFPMLGCCVIGQFYAGIGKPRFTLLISLISLPLTIILAYGFVLGHFGFPKLGLSGVTSASLIVQTLVMVGVLLIMYFRENIKAYGLFNKPFLPRWLICKSIFTLGMPIGIQFGGEFVAITMAAYLMGHFGVTALAASQISGQYYMLIIILLIGLTQALSILVSEAYGKGDYDLINAYIHASIFILIICCLLVAIVFCGFPKELIRFFAGEKIVDVHLQYLTIAFLAINTVLLFVDGLRHLLSGALRGLHDSHGPMRIGIVALWLISLPTCYLTGFPLKGGPIGLRIGFLSGFVFAAVVLMLRVRKKLCSPIKIKLGGI